MDPIAALEEIAALLERERASRYRAKAFRRAAAVLEGMASAERDDLALVRRASGIGDTTFTVIEQARSGRVPDYLAELRGSAPPPASALRGRLRGDLHSHSEWSDGATPVLAMADAARALGHEYLALTDHSPRLRVAHGLSAERLEEQLAHLAGLDTGPLRLLSGIEVDVLEDGALDQTDELLDRLDVVVASAHSKLRLPSREMTARLVAAASDPRTDVLGHVTGRLVSGERGTRPPSTFDARAVFRACADHSTAVEINARPEREDPPDELIAVALEEGCLFSIDSDAHAPGQLGLLDYGAERAERLGVPEERIVTTWPVERLLEWTRG
ncbi:MULTISPECIES: PHP domain-containing protein [unclassified Rathayibacter]|uniref:PHP domain-containing protein n=1 Tax=unclassified Rathayibacter TaxID=2609250 RepID=UPI000CE76050|nr:MULTISPECIES: PHP domain-containing protein [unclassified Rathayibacter]PPH16283.1 PHP domain-containing protein [Rathayibacter sp. AY1F8]PPH45219.1 PHP domain-containing protein [Rathayibacter sp. AY1C9]PPH73973.1 PHP domain-containing protein [Rathayibacter sp. AY1D4]QHC72490.1 PHP domain-containing protein [Rathayibacter sp. VKM Ac-2805]QHF21338.1 PHP domain-containing protein [Rathayibacter sp. VKM Ac-2762]